VIVRERVRTPEHGGRVDHELGVRFERETDRPQQRSRHEDREHDHRGKNEPIGRRAPQTRAHESSFRRATRYCVMAATRIMTRRIWEAALAYPTSQRLKPISYMNSTIGREALLGPPCVMSCAWPNSWNCRTTSMITTSTSVRRMDGSVTPQNVFQGPALSRAAAS